MENEKKIDKRVKYMIVLDTETAPMDKDNQTVNPYNMLVYDLGFAVVDRRGKVYESHSFVNADVFIDEKLLMKSAYYANKIPNYWKEIKEGKRQLRSFYGIRAALVSAIEKYGVSEIYAHNHYFDMGALNTTERWLTKSKYRYFYPYGVRIFDTLKMSRQVINTPMYREFCETHEFVTKTGKPRFTAEIIYRYISGNVNFEEEHTGLADVMIEKEILAYCFRKHKKMDGEIFKKEG